MKRNHCLICHAPIIETLSFASLCQKQSTTCCGHCAEQLERIPENSCLICSKPYEGPVCSDCVTFERQTNKKRVPNHSLYVYNEKMKEIVAQWKFRGDTVIIDAFREEWRAMYQQKFRQYTVVPIPIHDTRLVERGFNQAMQLANMLTNEPLPLLIRTDAQAGKSKWSKRERLTNETHFQIHDKINVKSPIKKVLLIDDIYTTGMTIQKAYETLQTITTIEDIQAMTLVRAYKKEEM